MLISRMSGDFGDGLWLAVPHEFSHGSWIKLGWAGVVAVLRQLFPHRFEDDEVQVQVGPIWLFNIAMENPL